MAVEKGLLTADEAALLKRAEEARADAIQVDSFTTEEYFASAVEPAGRPATASTGDGVGRRRRARGAVGFGDPIGTVGDTDPARSRTARPSRTSLARADRDTSPFFDCAFGGAGGTVRDRLPRLCFPYAA